MARRCKFGTGLRAGAGGKCRNGLAHPVPFWVTGTDTDRPVGSQPDYALLGEAILARLRNRPQ
jgi:hypothetical protein